MVTFKHGGIWLAGAALMGSGLSAAAAPPSGSRPAARVQETAAPADTAPADAASQGSVVLHWNRIALRTIAEDRTPALAASRTLAMESLAVFETLRAIQAMPGGDAAMRTPADAAIIAAVASAAHDVLIRLHPDQKAALDAAYADALAKAANDPATLDGAALGKRIAERIVADRAGDGHDATIGTKDGAEIGIWRPTAPGFLPALTPQWARMRPFALRSARQFRPGPPPARTSTIYAEGVARTQRLGAADSNARTVDQTETARFWAAGQGDHTPPVDWNLIAAMVAAARGDGLVQTARMFALLNIAMADAGIAAWDAKYTYTSWRPDTAIHNADKDGNAATILDAEWKPLLADPNHPEYVSGHSAFAGAASTVLARLFGDATRFSVTHGGSPGATHRFTSFSQAAAEIAESRIYGGVHFDFSNRAGLALGQKVARWTIASFGAARDRRVPRGSATGTGHGL